MNSFSVVLSNMRREKGRSQRQAASDLGISQALLSHYENGAREPKLDFIVKACDYYGISADYILGRVDELTPQRLPAPHGCEGAPRLISAVYAIFNTLEELSDPDLYSAAINYILIPIENTATLLCGPETPYDPARDAEMKLAEARFVTLIRQLQTGAERPKET